MTRHITEEEKKLLDDVMEMDVPLETKEYNYHSRDGGSVSMIIMKNGVEHTMEGQSLLPEKWRPFVILANIIAGNCGTLEDHHNELFVHTPVMSIKEVDIEIPAFLKDILE